MHGFNTEVKRNGVRIHVQTQDQGKKAQYVESLVYASGKIIASRKTYYTSHLNQPDLDERIKQIIETQHARILQEISTGHFDHLLRPEEKPGSP